ncbi:MAG: hypothetical protein PHE61_00265 [Candidatus Omnitrophica bacterium]|nr:hypothetical protein [Candidatus Omnitrophota bacterium]
MKGRYIFLFVIALAVGVAAGIVANHFLSGKLLCGRSAVSPAKIVTAEEFVLVGKDGKTYARLGMEPQDASSISPNPVLTLMDGEGNVRAKLGSSAIGSTLDLYDSDNAASVSLRVGHYAGEANLTVRDKRGAIDIGSWHYSDELQYLGLVFYDERGGSRARLTLAGERGPYLEIFGEDGNRGFRLALDRGESPMFYVLDNNGDARIKLGLKDDGNPGISFVDKDGKVSWSR